MCAVYPDDTHFYRQRLRSRYGQDFVPGAVMVSILYVDPIDHYAFTRDDLFV